MNTGGLAHMSYNNGYGGSNNNNNNSNTGFGSAAPGYGSRGKGAHIKRLSVQPPSSGMNAIYEDEVTNPMPRTARSQLLAGLRTAPKQANNMPASAPHGQQAFSQPSSAYPTQTNVRGNNMMPQTATASTFNRTPSPNTYGQTNTYQQNVYPLQQQVQASPDVHDGNEQMDPQVYNVLMQQNLMLLQRQQQLQQQLASMTTATQQLQNMNINGDYKSPPTPITPSMSLYNQQYQQGLQPVVQPTAQPGVYSVYNPMTGQSSYFYDNQIQSPVSPLIQDPIATMTNDTQGRYPRQNTTSPPANVGFNKLRTSPPPKATPSPQPDVAPLPPPSANAYRPGHRKSMSSALASAAKELDLNGPKTAQPGSSFPRTALTGGFGPGMARAGLHPVRQPRGPPPMDELLKLPTALHEGSKNFASRQRRLAVNDLVKAGKERNASRNSSSDFGTPASETEINFVISDADSEGSSSATGSASLSGDATFGNAKYGAAIGSEWKQLKERAQNRTPTSRPFSASGVGGLDGAWGSFGQQTKDFAGVVKSEGRVSPALSERRSPLLVLTSAAEKRKSMIL